ncbi:hypothetical protein DPMN_013568 [Dreissena polymorpha]|uniref:Uncharacterized protein n=1 Tax=Dreissena polymorpha TaxID=45954 RepID=A0A9D4N807_DREPO|nr:hypothetical protein DPMN_013568 [Dreissena polymorpha]
MSSVSSKNRSPCRQFILVNFDPPQALREIYGVGPRFARVIVQLRESVVNPDIRTLEVVIKRPLSYNEMDFLNSPENPRLVDDALASHSEGEYIYAGTPYLTQDREAQERVQAELTAEISNLEADITARCVERQVRWLKEVVRGIGVCIGESTEGGNGKTSGVDDVAPLALPTVREGVRDIGVCIDMSTVGGNDETVGRSEGTFTENVDDAVPLALPTVREVVRDIGVCTDMSTVGGNDETVGGSEGTFTENVDDSVPLALPTVREVVRDIGVCTDI